MKLQWKITTEAILYQDALVFMENYVDSIIKSQQPNLIWLLEHFDVYTKGTSAEEHDLLSNPKHIPVINSNRGGKITYHGQGQRVIYAMINLKATPDIKLYIHNLETWVINTLQQYNLDAFIKDGFIGVWLLDQGVEKKIAALGVRVRKWVAYHGIAVNISPDLKMFNNIVPCGINNLGVTSLQQLKKDISFKNFDSILQKNTPIMF